MQTTAAEGGREEKEAQDAAPRKAGGQGGWGRAADLAARGGRLPARGRAVSEPRRGRLPLAAAGSPGPLAPGEAAWATLPRGRHAGVPRRPSRPAPGAHSHAAAFVYPCPRLRPRHVSKFPGWRRAGTHRGRPRARRSAPRGGRPAGSGAFQPVTANPSGIPPTRPHTKPASSFTFPPRGGGASSGGP